MVLGKQNPTKHHPTKAPTSAGCSWDCWDPLGAHPLPKQYHWPVLGRKNNLCCWPASSAPAIFTASQSETDQQGTNAIPHAFPSPTTWIIHPQRYLVVTATGCMERPLVRLFNCCHLRGVAKAPALSLPWGQRGDANLDTQLPGQETARRVRGG